jgi:hypothetical protein
MSATTKRKPAKRRNRRPDWSQLADHEKAALAKRLEHLCDGAFSITFEPRAFLDGEPDSTGQILAGYPLPDAFDDEIHIDLRDREFSPQRQFVRSVKQLASRLESLAEKMLGRVMADEQTEGGAT